MATDAARGLASRIPSSLPARVDGLSATAQENALDQAVGLGAMPSESMARQRSRHAAPRILIKMRLRAIIESRLTESDLDAATVAAAAGISVRRANAALADEQTSIKAMLLEARLEHCRRAINDPAQSCRTLSEIAQGCGFADVTHLARTFKAAYGLLPSEYRMRNRMARRATMHPASYHHASAALP